MVDYKKLIYQCCANGSTWVAENALVEYAKQFGGRLEDLDCCLGKGIVREIGKNGEYLYTTKEISDMEQSIAENVMRVMYQTIPMTFDDELIEKIVEKFEITQNKGRKLHYHQVDAVKMVVNNNLSVLTGGPGTGKTTVLSAITYTLRKLNDGISIVYTAPTGKAAKRITESTGENATTLHKKLGIGFDTKRPDRFYEDVLFIDESSMNDTSLTYTLLNSVTNGRKIVFVGDVDQLPSVGIGAILRDLISSKVIPVTMLTHTFRQNNSSVLFQNICNVREGIPELVKGNDFTPILLEKGDKEIIAQKAEKLICEYYKSAIEEYGSDNVVVLLPYRKKGVCSNKMNNCLQKLVNKSKQGYKYTNTTESNTIYFKKGDYVMQLKNQEICANGDVGQVIDVSEDGVTVQYTDGIVKYKNNLDELALAYAMSIHKSQGSEYKCVIMALLDEHTSMLSRNLLYTGITRSKEKCVLIYQNNAFKTAISVQADKNRITRLAQCLQQVKARYRTLYGV